MSAKPSDRYKGKVRPFILLSPAEDKAIAIESIHLELTKSEYIRRAVVFCMNNNIDLSKDIDLLKDITKK